MSNSDPHRMKPSLSECYGLIRTENDRLLKTPNAVANTRRDGLVDRELADVVVFIFMG
jgi:hypothetical protein